MNMQVLMFGWEFPPYISGGLGTACHGICAGFRRIGGTDVHLVLPGAYSGEDRSVANIINLAEPQSYEVPLSGAISELLRPYSATLMPAALAYAARVPSLLDTDLRFDVIHAHDWLTAPAALAAKEISGRPFVFHVHSTEYDRAGLRADPDILKVEQMAMNAADCIIAVSEFTRTQLIERFGQPEKKVVTVYNATEPVRCSNSVRRTASPPLISFLGRITHQKGPRYFVEAAHLALQRCSDLQFVMAGEGDLMAEMQNLAEELRIDDRLHFPGFLRGLEVQHLLARSSVYVMPSVSEPFGISALEAIEAGVPVILSQQSGVAELFDHAIKVDHWDVPALSCAMVSLAQDPILSATLASGARQELSCLSWEGAAQQVQRRYQHLLAWPRSVQRPAQGKPVNESSISAI